MNSWDFTGSRLKVERAIHHIKDLDLCYSTWQESEPVYIAAQKNIDTGKKSFKLAGTKSIPDDFPLILADAIHNLRSALDFIAVEIVAKGGKDNIKHVYFPFRETREELIVAMEEGKIPRASREAADVILNRIQPYKAGIPFIWYLNRFSNTDKHRLLIPTIIHSEFIFASLEDGKEIWPAIFRADWLPTKTSINDPSVAEFKIKSDGEVSHDIFFLQAEESDVRVPIHTFLRHCASLIGNFIHVFEVL